ncbi:hypothetical protein SCP_1203200 [Sparassis crispa]|uniref:Aminoglycoside phosphotransferase domain-containing protein n=1 Tax=Sparassis crispa TaxID=139825 RepID=A0A401H0Z0_9APHY|nr:hypothetical protein SCP_1203200 [Sparassis crispa]GBE88091.1 hypothetical protein SCP_1203200 [Sparassis crispa]
MGGMNYHVNIIFEDGVVWLCRIRRRDVSSPPTVLQNRILLSEAATLRYLSTTSVPVPKVYDAIADSPSNPVGVGYILMEKLQGKSLDWFDLDRDGKSKILEQLAQIYIELEKHVFPAIGCLEEGGVVGQLVNSAAADVDAVGDLQLMGPFTTSFKYRYTLVMHQLAIIGNGEVYASKAHAVDAYLVHRYLLDHMSLFVPQDEMEKSGYYLKHMDDKGDHILVDEALNILGVVDWEWAQTTSKREAQE